MYSREFIFCINNEWWKFVLLCHLQVRSPEGRSAGSALLRSRIAFRAVHGRGDIPAQGILRGIKAFRISISCADGSVAI